MIDDLYTWLVEAAPRWVQWAFLTSALALPAVGVYLLWAWAAACDMPGAC